MNLNSTLTWQDAGLLPSKAYTCGYCGSALASENGYWATDGTGNRAGAIHVCHFCNRPTFFDPGGDQIPGIAFGDAVQHVSDQSVHNLYEEARNATAANCFTACVLCCRKLLMHIAVCKGAKEGQPFSHYVDYLAQKNFVPPDAHSWVDHIRTKGNEANHEISIMKREDAEELLSFLSMLLRIIYEFPEIAKRKYPNKNVAQHPAP